MLILKTQTCSLKVKAIALKGHSTEMASLILVDRILSFMDNGEKPLGIFLDLSKAFDTLNHTILLHKLKHYGLSENSTGLIKIQIQTIKKIILVYHRVQNSVHYCF